MRLSSPLSPSFLRAQPHVLGTRFGCRLLATFSPKPQESANADILHQLLLKADNNLRHQCLPNRYPNLPEADPINNSNPDGWGVVAYGPKGQDMLVLKNPYSAREDARFIQACLRVKEHCPQVMLAHVRMASPFLKSVDRNNTHPFVYGQWSLIHNGTILEPLTVQGQKKLQKLSQRHLDHAPRGETDSEATLYLLLGQLAAQFKGVSVQDIGLGRVKHFFRNAMSGFYQAHQRMNTAVSQQNRPVLNMMLTDGDHVLAVRSGASLYLGRPKSDSPDGTPFVLASEPIGLKGTLKDSLIWQSVPEHHCVTLGRDRTKKVVIHMEALPGM